MAGEDIVANVRLNTTEFFGSLRQMNSEINSQTREWKAQFSALSKSGDWVGAYKAKVEGLNATYDKQQEKIKLLRSQMDAIGTPKTSKDSDQLKKLTGDLKTAEAQAKLFDTQLKNSNLALEKSKTGIHELGAEHKILSQMTKANSEVFEKQGLQYTANREKAIGLSSELKNLNAQYRAQGDYLKILKSTYSGYNDEQKQSDTYAKQLARDIKLQETAMMQTGSAIRNNKVEYSSLGKNIGLVGQGVTLTSDHISNMGGKLTSSGQKLQQFGFFGQTASAGLMTMFKQGFEGSSKLDQSLRETYNMLDKKPSGGINAFLKDYQSQIADLSKQWGVSQNDIADGMQEVIRAGYDSKSAFDIARSSMQTSMATGEDYGKIMDGTTEIMSQFGLKTDDASKNMENANLVQNALAKVANDTKTSYVGLSDAMAKVGPIAHDMGYSVEETGAMIGYMANKGIDASQAGNNLKMVFQRLSAQTPQATEALKALGISATDSQGNLKKIPDIMNQINDATKNMGSSERSAYIKKIFGAYATTAATALLDGQPEIEKEASAAGKAVSDGYTKSLAESNKQGAAAQMKIFKAQWEALSMEFANSIMPLLSKTMGILGDLMKKFDSLSPSTKKLVAEFLAIGAIAAPAAIAIGSVSIVAGTLLRAIGGVLPKLAGFVSLLGRLNEVRTAGSALEVLSGSMSKTGTEAAVAEKSAGTLSGTIAKLIPGATAAGVGMTAMGAAAIAGTALAGYGIATLITKNQEHKDKLAQVKQQMNDTYGGDVTKGQKAQVDSLVESEQNAKVAIAEIGNQKINPENLEAFKTAVEKLQAAAAKGAQETNGKANEKLQKDNQALNNPYLTSAGINAIKADKGDQEDILKSSQKAIDAAKKYGDEINKIVEQASADNRKLTGKELQSISGYYHDLVGVGIQNISGMSSKQKALLEKMYNNDDLSKATTGALEKANSEYAKAFASSFKDTTAQVEQAYEHLSGKQRQIVKDDAWGQFFKKNSDSIKPFVNNWNAQTDKLDMKKWSQFADKQYTDSYSNLSKTLKEAGIDVGEFAKQFGILKPAQMNAMQMWDQMSPALRSLNTDFSKSQKAMLNSVSGTKEWNDLSIKEKSLIINDKASTKLISAAKKSGEWDKLTPKQKELLLKDLASGKTDEANKRLKAYDKNIPKGKKLTATDSASATLKKAGISLDAWNKLNPKQKQAVAKDLASGNVGKARGSVALWNGQKISSKDAKAANYASPILNKAGLSVKQWNALPEDVKKAVGKDLASGNINGAKATVDRFRNTPIGPVKTALGTNSTSGNIDPATGSVNRFRGASTGSTKVARSSQQGKASVEDAIGVVGRFMGLPSVVTKTMQFVTERIEKFIKGRAGGGTVEDGETATWLGDGGKNEPYVTPSGLMGISGNNWELHSLEPGTIVYPSMSAYTQMTGNQIDPAMIPKFAGGGTVPYTGQLQAVDYINSEVKNQQSEVILSGNSNSNADVVNELKNAVNLLSKLISVQQDKTNINVVLNKDELYKTASNDVSLRNIQSLT